MRGIIAGFLIGAGAVTLVGCPFAPTCDVEDILLVDGLYRSEGGASIAPFHPDGVRELELAGDTLVIRWTDDDGVETVETWQVGEVQTAE